MASLHCHSMPCCSGVVQRKAVALLKIPSVSAHRGVVPPALALRQTAQTFSSIHGSDGGIRGMKVIVAGSSKQSMYTVLPERLDEPTPGFDSIASALEDLAAGKFVVVLDDEDRENEGDLIINADKVTTEAMAFMVEHTSGVICISMEGRDLDRLKLPLMVQSAENDESMYTAFTITLDLRVGTTTGISAADRAATLRAMADPERNPDDFRRPGHIFPLRYRQGGVIVRPGHTEAAVDLARASGSYPAGVLCEIVDRSDGSMARTPQLMQFAKQHGLKIITIADLIRYRLRHEQLLQQVAAAPLETRHGTFSAYCFKSLVDGFEHAALVAGDVSSSSSSSSQHHQQQIGVLARIQQQHHLTDVFGSLQCGQGPFLDQAMAQIAATGTGVVLYVQGHSTAGKGLAAELEQYTTLQQTCSTPTPGSSSSSSSDSLAGANRSGASSSLSADLRDAAAAAHMLKHLGVQSVALMTDDEAEVQRLRCCGIGAQVTQWPSPAAETLEFGSSSSRAHLQAMLEMTNGSSSSSSGSNSSGGGSLNGTAAAAAGASH